MTKKKTMKTEMTPEEVSVRLEQIASAMKSGKSAAAFQAELDAMLDTGMDARDPVMDAAWESQYRGEET